jgi:hypothetical protein
LPRHPPFRSRSRPRDRARRLGEIEFDPASNERALATKIVEQRDRVGFRKNAAGRSRGSGGPEAFLLAVFLGVIPDDFVVQPMLGMNSGEALLNVSYLAQVSGGVAF